MAEAIGVTRLVAERNQLQKRLMDSSHFQLTTAASRTTYVSALGVLGPPPSHCGNSNQSASDDSPIKRREKVLCYYCDEKFSPSHQCQRPQLFMIEDFDELSIYKDEPAETETESQEVVLEISFHAISGSSHPQTIRVLGRIGNKL